MSAESGADAIVPDHTDDATAPVAGRSRALPDVIALGALIAVMTFVLAVAFWSRYNLYRLDIITFYIPWYEHLGERLRDADIPGWMPYAMSGSPFAGDPQSGWGYLPAMAVFTIAPSIAGYVVFVGFHVLLAAVGTYLYARIIGIGPLGAFAAGAAFTLGNFMERTACCTIHMQVAVWIPAIFACYELSRRARSTAAQFGWLVAAGIGTGQMIAGWVGQGAYYGCVAVGAYLLYRTFGNRDWRASLADRVRSLLLIALVIGIVGASTAGPALWPRLETVGRSNLADLYEDDESASETGWGIRTVPDEIFSATNIRYRNYLGAVLLTLTIIGACLTLRRRHALFFTIFGLTIFALIIKPSPVENVFTLLPRFEDLHTHSPDRVYVVLFLAPAVLIGWLIQTLLDRDWRAREHLPAAITAIVLPVLALLLAIRYSERPLDSPRLGDRVVESGVVIAVVAVALLISHHWVRRAAAVILILLLLNYPTGDLVRLRLEREIRRGTLTEIVDNHLTPNGAARWLQDRAESGAYFRFFGYDQVQLMNQGELRTYHVSHSDEEAWRILVNNRGIQFDLHDIQGYNPVQISTYVELMDAINGVEQSYHAANVLASGLDSPLLNQLNVRYIVVPTEIPPGRPDLSHLVQRYPTVYIDDDSRILENPEALPRAWIVHDADVVETNEDIFTRFALRLDDPAETVLLASESIDPPELESPGDAGAESVVVTSYEPDEIHLEVTATATGMLVLSEIWDPGWSATVDGDEVEIYRANAVFRGVVVPPGTHEIVLTYPAESVKRSLLLYLVPIAALAAIPVLRRRRFL